MNKVICFFAVLILCISSANAKQVDRNTAKQVAENYLSHNAKLHTLALVLLHTEKSASGEADYYVFDINNNTGFVIVSAEDAGHPIIGYSTEGPFVAPGLFPDSNFAWWMEQRKNEIEYMRTHNLQPDLKTANEWNSYTTNKVSDPQIMGSVAPLCSTSWNQSGYYNDLCPSNSLAGCVAISMGAIMKKWKHPVQGTGSSSYASNYGTLSVNYGTTTYDWANMSNTLSSSSTSAQKNAVAKLIYHCGVSVEMGYSPSASGSKIINSKPSAKYSLFTYFGYDATLIKGVYRSSYTDQAWIALLQDDLNKGRPILYGGMTTGNSGHAWVCDGYDATNNFHMNWGWGGSSNGYFSVNNLNAGSYNFSEKHHACAGIQPKTSATGIMSSNASEGFSMYPNPVISEVIIEGTTKSDKVHYSVCNMLGAEIKSGDISATANNFSEKINLYGIPNGMYFLKVSNGDSAYTRKLYKH